MGQVLSGVRTKSGQLKKGLLTNPVVQKLVDVTRVTRVTRSPVDSWIHQDFYQLLNIYLGVFVCCVCGILTYRSNPT